MAIGQAGGRFELTPERVGINIDDARIPDNEGNQPIDEVIQSSGDAAYFSNLPVKRMTEAIKSAGVPARLSNTAGTFVCNHILYQLGFYKQHNFQILNLDLYMCLLSLNKSQTNLKNHPCLFKRLQKVWKLLSKRL